MFNIEGQINLMNMDIKGMQVAFVMNFLDNNTVGIYFPKLMSDIDMSDNPREKSVFLNSNMIKNKIPVTFNTEIKECNYIKAKPLNIRGTSSNLMPIGSQIFVECIDEDVKKIYYLPFNIDERDDD